MMTVEDLQVNCGDIRVDFFEGDDYSQPLDYELFDDWQSTNEAKNLFTILQTDDEMKVGEYQISYRAYYIDYPENFAEKINAFTVTIVNLCENPNNLSVPLQDFVDPYLYTGSAPALDFKLNGFEIDPSYCPVLYTCSVVAGVRMDLL